MKKLLLAMVISLCSALPATAAPVTELTPYFSSQYFTWTEHNDVKRFLKESGPLFSAGVLFGVTSASSVTLRVREEVFGGQVGYDGQNRAGAPVKTDVSYFGTKQELDLGVRLPSSALRLEPFAGLGYRWWLRNLQDSVASDGTPNGTPAPGYTELWQTLYGRFGGRVRFPTPSGAIVFAEGGGKYPFYSGNSINSSSGGTLTFHTVGRWSAFAETGVSWQRLKVAAFYEGFRFGHSPPVADGSNNPPLYQPDSSSDIYGLSLGWAFR